MVQISFLHNAIRTFPRLFDACLSTQLCRLELPLRKWVTDCVSNVIDIFRPNLLVLPTRVTALELSTDGVLRKYDARCFSFLKRRMSAISDISANAVKTLIPFMLVNKLISAEYF